jgi:type IV pilus assembly protein PilX
MTNDAPTRLQRGMALIVSLVLLLSMTLLALAAMQNTSLEERMAGNVRSENIALQAAESALRAAEAWLATQVTPPAAANGGGSGINVWSLADGTSGPNSVASASGKLLWWEYWTDQDWLDHGDVVSTSLNYVGGSSPEALAAARAPRFVIEEVTLGSLVIGRQQTNQVSKQYRITARGLDAGGRGTVLLQSRFNHTF